MEREASSAGALKRKVQNTMRQILVAAGSTSFFNPLARSPQSPHQPRATNRALNLGENASRRPSSRQIKQQTSLSRENLNLSTAQCGHAALVAGAVGTPRYQRQTGTG
jgi:hypothetical protein